MFEKEAEKYAYDFHVRQYEHGKSKSVDEVWQDGAKFGYNKANEWHYPSKGEYPEYEFIDESIKSRLPSAYKRFYCLYLGDDCVIGKYIKGSFWTVEWQYSLNEIVAWKEIVFP